VITERSNAPVITVIIILGITIRSMELKPEPIGREAIRMKTVSETSTAMAIILRRKLFPAPDDSPLKALAAKSPIRREREDEPGGWCRRRSRAKPDQKAPSTVHMFS
jgi:hypothetical protein